MRQPRIKWTQGRQVVAGIIYDCLQYCLKAVATVWGFLMTSKSKVSEEIIIIYNVRKIKWNYKNFENYNKIIEIKRKPDLNDSKTVRTSVANPDCRNIPSNKYANYKLTEWWKTKITKIIKLEH